MDESSFTVDVPITVTRGWAVACMVVWEGDDDPESVSDVDVFVVEIRPDTCRVVGGVVCVSLDGPRFDMWAPVANFRADLPDVPDDSHDFRDHLFATEEEANEHAADVRRTWEQPNPWTSFVVLGD